MSPLLSILFSASIALANTVSIRWKASDCNEAETFCSSTSKGHEVSTDGWLADASTIHGIFGPERTVTMAGTPKGKLVDLCCPTSITKCGLLVPGNIALCYKPLDSGGGRFALSDGEWGHDSTGDLYNVFGDHINLVTGDYDYRNGTTGNWYVDRGQKPHSSSTSTTDGGTATSTDSGGSATSTDSGGSTTSTSGASTTQVSSSAEKALAPQLSSEVIGMVWVAIVGLIL